MRPALLLAPVLTAAAVVLSGCGYAGEPKPPALRRPEKVANLAAVERGAKIIVTFILPQETTESLPISEPPDIEMRIGLLPRPWNLDTWQTNSDRIPVPAWQPVARAASGGGVRTTKRATSGVGAARGASGASGASGMSAAQRRKAVRTAAATTIAENRVWFSRTVEIDAAKYTDKSTVIGVRVHGPKGRDDGWSMVSLDVQPVLPVPRNVHAVDAPGAVHLTWVADAPAFRIFHRLSTDSEWEQIGESTQPSFDDKTFSYGKAWQYYVQSVRKVGDHWLESDVSETITFTPVDRFPPAVPSGLGAIAGTRTIELSWDLVTDADLAGYRVYRNGVKVGEGVQTTAFSDPNVVAGTKYSYQVSSVDSAGNESAKSVAAEITME